jgi:mRNA-degrading endonuclease HigB of HigAB toxin-antitoxin module
MVIISKTVLVDFGGEHADSVDALNKWYEICKKNDWKNLNELKKKLVRWILWVTTGMFLILKEINTDL